MLSMFKKLFNSSEPKSDVIDDSEVNALARELVQLEARLSANPADNATQKALMIKYNQAIKVYSSHRHYRNQVDDLFVKMDELRNTIRKNI